MCRKQGGLGCRGNERTGLLKQLKLIVFLGRQAVAQRLLGCHREVVHFLHQLFAPRPVMECPLLRCKTGLAWTLANIRFPTRSESQFTAVGCTLTPERKGRSRGGGVTFDQRRV